MPQGEHFLGISSLQNPMAVHVFTSVTSNYIPKARVLADSVKRFHRDFVFHLVLVDPTPSWFRIEQEPFNSVINVCDLGFKNTEQWLFKHSLVEACTGVKGRAFTNLLAKRDCSAVFYFDPDIVVLSDLGPLLAELDKASVLLTPHLTEPEQTLEAIHDNEFSVLQHGVYNLGFLAVKNSLPQGFDSPAGGRIGSMNFVTTIFPMDSSPISAGLTWRQLTLTAFRFYVGRNTTYALGTLPIER